MKRFQGPDYGPHTVLDIDFTKKDGSSFRDDSQYGHEITVYGAQRRGNQGYYLDGVDDYFGLGPVINIVGSITLEAVVKFDSLENYQIIISKGLGGHTYYLQKRIDTNIIQARGIKSDISVSQGKLYHIIYSFNATSGTTILLINGIVKTISGFTTLGESNPTENLNIGIGGDSKEYPLKGSIYYIRIQKGSSTVQEMLYNYISKRRHFIY